MVAFDVSPEKEDLSSAAPAREASATGVGARQRRVRLGIAGKVALIKISFGLITAAVISLILYHAMLSFVAERQQEAQKADVKLAVSRLATQFDSAQRDTILALNAPPLQGLIRATTNGSVDPLDDTSLTLTHTRTGELFSALLTARPIYVAVQFIDRNGYEVVQAVRDASGGAVILPPADLTTAAHRPYFAEAAKLPAGGIYVADIEPLQVEGRIVHPPVPIARVSCPVYNAIGGLVGVVVISIDARKLFKAVSTGLAPGSRVYVANEGGTYLLNPDASRTFGPERIQDDFPALTSLIDKSRDEYSAASGGDDTTLFSASTLAFDPQNPARRLIVAAQQAVSVSFSQIGSGALLIGTVFSLVLLMGGVTALVLVRVLVLPLRRIRTVAIDLAGGHRDVDVEQLTRRRDEIGDLAKSVDAMAQAIAEREDRLTAQTAELKRSNEDLGQFAYVASHDLQEPLRMVGSYLELLSRRYKGKLDQEADEFIGFAVDGATRMKRLINDLLGYSRAGSTPLKWERLDVGGLLKGVLASLGPHLQETGGAIEVGPMPMITGDASQIERIFQNLIDNALKYHSEAPPHIRISATPADNGWQFAVADNGIGIDPRFKEQIFEIFKRLHGREQYSGTGIGLAVTKLVVERHGGRIWVEPVTGGGSVFYFTIPEAGITG